MARPKSISNEEILKGARELFLERGPSVPTAEIARHLGVSEGLLFQRFPTKHALFLAAMGIEDPEHLRQRLEKIVGQGELKSNLVQVTAGLLKLFRELLPRIMLVWSCRPQPHPEDLRDLHGEHAPPKRGLIALTRYFEREMALGRLRQGDPEVVARIFLGSIWNLVFMETIGQAQRVADPEGYARSLVNMLWEGLAPVPVDGGGAKMPGKKSG